MNTNLILWRMPSKISASIQSDIDCREDFIEMLVATVGGYCRSDL